MIAMQLSCNPEKLRQVIRACKVTMKGFYGLTAQDREDILLEVVWKFEKDEGKFPATVYGRYCVNKVLQFIEHKTAKKRMTQTEVNGETIYIEDVSLSLTTDEDEKLTVADTIACESQELEEVEFFADVERADPSLLPIIKRVLAGAVLTRNERNRLKTRLLNKVCLY